MLNSELPSRSLPVVITEASVCIALCIISVIGNSLVCMATCRNSNLRSTTNLYIIALAVSDLLCGIAQMPLTSATLIFGRWVFGDALNQFQGFVSAFTYYVTPAIVDLSDRSSAVRKFKINSVMIKKKKLILSHTQEYVDIMTNRFTQDIFITKDAICDDMLPLLLILFKYELGSWTKFIS